MSVATDIIGDTISWQTPQSFGRNMYVYMYTYMYAITMQNEAMDLKESGERYMGRFDGRKGKGEIKRRGISKAPARDLIWFRL